MTIKEQIKHIKNGLSYGFVGATFGAWVGGLGQTGDQIFFSVCHAIAGASLCFVIGFLAYCFEYIITRNRD